VDAATYNRLRGGQMTKIGTEQFFTPRATDNVSRDSLARVGVMGKVNGGFHYCPTCGVMFGSPKRMNYCTRRCEEEAQLGTM
jgi:hypothetical protein